MKKAILLINLFVLFVIFSLWGSASGSDVTITDANKSNFTKINKIVQQKVEAGEEVAVLIKLKEEWEKHSVQKMTTSTDPASYISTKDIKRLQRALELSFSPEERKRSIKIIRRLKNIPWITGKITLKAFNKLKVHPNVAIIEEDIPVKALLDESGPLIDSHSVNDLGFTAYGVTVAVLDTGIDTDHPDLQDDLVWEECFLTDSGCPLTGGTTASGPGGAEDGHGHGTHVSGIITSSHSTYQGIAPDSGIVAIKVLDDTGQGWNSDVMAGVDWATSNKDTYGIRAINMSLGGGLYSGTCDSNEFGYESVSAAKSAGIIIFASSGNDASSTEINAPACLSPVISVGSVYDASVGRQKYTYCTDETSQTDQIVCHSNVSSVLDLLAPGAIIDSSAIGGGITSKSGTSMASPHAAAVAAIIMQVEPSLTPDEVLQTLQETGVSLLDTRIGLNFPRINAQEALSSLTFNLTLSTTGTGSGTVNGNGVYQYGETATVSAIPDTGSTFTDWSGPNADECSVGSVIMVSDKSCIATFTLNTHILNLNTDGTGSGNVTGAGTYNFGDTAIVTTTPDTGSIFAGWSGPDGPECTSGSVSMIADKSCTATFTLNTYTLTLETDGTGSGSLTGAGTYDYGDTAVVNATPDTGSTLFRWRGPDAHECSSGFVSIVEDKSCTATFKLSNNNSPVFTSIAITTATETLLYNYNITAEDADAGNVLSITALIIPAWLSLTDSGDGTALLSGTPAYDQLGDFKVSLSVEDSAGGSGSQHFIISVSENIVSVNLDLPDNWSLISLPVTPDNSNLTFIFPDAEVAYKFDGTYQLVTTLEPGTGYWVKLTNGGIYSITGRNFAECSLTLAPGWHLVGGINATATPTTEPPGEIDVVYDFEGTYSVATEFLPGKGYWVKVNNECQFNVSLQN